MRWKRNWGLEMGMRIDRDGDGYRNRNRDGEKDADSNRDGDGDGLGDAEAPPLAPRAYLRSTSNLLHCTDDGDGFVTVWTALIS